MLTVTQMLRKKGVVNKFVEFYGPGLDDMPLADRATIANMAPEYGATCGFFPIDAETIRFLKASPGAQCQGAPKQLVEAYAKKQGMWRDAKVARPGLHRHAGARSLSRSNPSLAGPKRPQDRVPLSQAAAVQAGAHGEGNSTPIKDDGKRITGRVPITIWAMATW